MSDKAVMQIWSSAARPSDRILTIADLKKFRQLVSAGGHFGPEVAVMSPRIYDGYKDAIRTEAVRRFLGIVGPFEPITVKSVRRSITRKWGTFTYRLRKAIRVMRYGYDPEDM